MASVINTNMASLVAQRNLSGSQGALATSVERLSSGLRINRAKDDAAGLGIAAKLQSQVKGIDQSIRNAGDAISVVQTAEGALDQVATMLQRMKEIATQGNNDALSTTQRLALMTEANALSSEITATQSRTTFNGATLLASTATLSFQTGNSTADTTTVDLSIAQVSTLTAGSNLTAVASYAVANFTALSDAVDNDITTVATMRSVLGATQNRLDNAIGNLQTSSSNLAESRSRIIDTDYAAETAQLTKNQIQQQAATAMLAQANQMPNAVLSLLK
jgi:flagellin